MDSHGPEFVSRRLVAFLDQGDVEGLLGLYEDEALFVDLDGAARGRNDIRAAHQGFLEAGLVLKLHDSVVFESGDLALVHWSWTVRHRDGSSTDGVSAEVLRRQLDGEWKFIIDNSDGSAVVGIL